MEKQKTAERETFYEGTSSVSSFMQDLVRYLALQVKRKDRTRKRTPTPSVGADLPSR
jgi:hypothetical protein